MRWPLVGFAYLVLCAGALLAASWRGISPWTYPHPWLCFDSSAAQVTYSGLLGLAVGALAIITTRVLVGRVPLVTRLHGELRPLTHKLPTAGILLLAISSAFGEELLFRGLLQPWIGLVLQALIFGSLHQTGGPGRWVWMGSATAMGLIFGAMYACAGSLVGPLLGHALINGFNLVHLRDFDPHKVPRRLGGLLSLDGHRHR